MPIIVEKFIRLGPEQAEMSFRLTCGQKSETFVDALE